MSPDIWPDTARPTERTTGGRCSSPSPAGTRHSSQTWGSRSGRGSTEQVYWWCHWQGSTNGVGIGHLKKFLKTEK